MQLTKQELLNYLEIIKDDIENYFDIEEDKTYYVNSTTKENGTLITFEVYTKDAL